jgi:nucleotide-binding universal stress UspA family protein
MFTSVIAGLEGSSADADTIALAELLLAPEGRLMPARIQPGRPVGRGLHDLARERDADLIVVGSSGRGLLGRILAGDDVIATLRGAPCAVAVAPHGFASAPHTLRTIGVGYDGSPHAQAAVERARELASPTGAHLRAIGVASPPQGLVTPIGISAIAALDAARDRAERCVAQLGAGLTAHAVDGIVHQRLTELSREVDLLVIGSSRRGALGRVLLGSTAESLSREAECALLVVPAPASSRPAQGRPVRPASAPAA